MIIPYYPADFIILAIFGDNFSTSVFFLASHFARGNLSTSLFSLASRFARGNLLTSLFFKASRFARVNWLANFFFLPSRFDRAIFDQFFEPFCLKSHDNIHTFTTLLGILTLTRTRSKLLIFQIWC